MKNNRILLRTAKGDQQKRLFEENFKIQTELEESCLVERIVDKNIVCNVGLTQLTKALSGNLSTLSEAQVNYAAVGSGSTTPAAGDTTLATETFRNTVNTLNYADQVFFASMFIDFTEDSGTYKEAALFINGTASADSGSMFDRVLLNAPTGIVKSTSQILTISFQITFTPV